MTTQSTTRILKSDDDAEEKHLRVFVAESNASDLFWLEMVFKSSRLPYRIEVATDEQAAREYFEQRLMADQPDLIFVDTCETLHAIPHTNTAPLFVLANATEREGLARTFGVPEGQCIEKPFTYQKLFDCLSTAALNAWVDQLPGKTRASAA